MMLQGKDFRTTFILGSGATRGALSHVLLNRKRIRPPLNSDFFEVAEAYVRACGASSVEAKRLDRLRRIFREHLPVRKDSLTMEIAFSLLFMAKDFPDIYSGFRGRRRTPGDSQGIEDFLQLAFGILTELDRVNQVTAYDKLVSGLQPRDTLITLNYDTLLDSALARKGWDPRKGYSISGSADKFKFKPTHVTPDLESVRLLKLHGSLNWFVRGSFSDLSSIFFKKPTRIERPRNNGVAGHVRQIVPPIYGKFFGHDHWRSLWAHAYRAICESDVLVVVGCSLIDTDFHLRALVGRVALARKKSKSPIRKLILVDRVRVRRKWARALRGAFVKQTGYKTFAVFLKKVVHI